MGGLEYMIVIFDRQDSLPIASGNIPLTTGTTMSQSMKSPTLRHGSEVQRLPASQKPFPSSLQGSAQHRAITMTTTLTGCDSAAPGLRRHSVSVQDSLQLQCQEPISIESTSPAKLRRLQIRR